MRHAHLPKRASEEGLSPDSLKHPSKPLLVGDNRAALELSAAQLFADVIEA